MHFHRRAILPFPTANQFIDWVIGQLRHIGTHRFAEDFVSSVQYVVAAAEVFLQDNPSVFRVYIIGIRAQTLHKQGRIGLAEAINGLLHVTDHEHDVVVVVNGLQNGVLHLADVLAFVHKNVVVLALHLCFQRRIRQHLHGELLHIGEINEVLFGFLCQESVMGSLCQRGKTTQMTLHRGEFQLEAIFVDGQVIADFLNHLLDLIALFAEPLAPLFFLLAQAADDLCFPQRKAVKCPQERFCRPLFHVKQCFTGCFIRLEGFPAILNSVFFFKHPPHGLQNGFNALHLHTCVLHQKLIPRVLPIGRLIDCIHCLSQPLEGLR